MKVKIINKSRYPLPRYAHEGDAGMDLRWDAPDDGMDAVTATIPPLGRVILPTGLYIQLPEGTEAQIRPRSGLAAKQGVTVLNSPGTIDCTFRGEIKVILVNLSAHNVVIKGGERIAQMVLAKHEYIDWDDRVPELEDTIRGEGGFGSTGTQ